MSEHTILCVDDEENILKTLRRLFMDEEWELLTATSGEEGLQYLKENTVDLIIADYRMPEMTGVEFLKKAKKMFPDTIRIILSGYADVDAISNAINEGEVYKFISKPWNDEELKVAVKRSLEQYELIRENKQLYEKIKVQNEALRALNESLEAKVAQRTAALELRNQALCLAQDILENLPIGIMGISLNREIVLVNREMTSMLEMKGKPVLGSKIEEHLPAEILDLVENTFRTEDTREVSGIRHRKSSFDFKACMINSFENRKGTMLIAQREQGKEDGDDDPAIADDNGFE